jgi:hypothetical protein
MNGPRPQAATSKAGSHDSAEDRRIFTLWRLPAVCKAGCCFWFALHVDSVTPPFVFAGAAIAGRCIAALDVGGPPAFAPTGGPSAATAKPKREDASIVWPKTAAVMGKTAPG